MEFPFNINLSQAPDDVFSLLNNLIASGTANTDEIKTADPSGLPPESSLPSFPIRHANEQQPPLVNGEIIGRESQVWNPYSTLPPLSICPSALTTKEPSSDDVAPQSSTVPPTEDENFALELELLLMPDLGPTYDFFNPYSDERPLLIGDSNKQSNEIIVGVSENHLVDVDDMSQVCNPYSDRLALPICESNVQSSEIDQSVSKNHFVKLGITSQVCNPYSDQLLLPICDSNVRSNEIVIQEVGVTSQICNPYSDRVSLPICNSNVRLSEIVIQEVGVTSQVCGSHVRLNEIAIQEVGVTSQVCNPYSDRLSLSICDSNIRLSEIVIQEVGVMSQVCNPYSDQLSLPIRDSNIRSSEIVIHEAGVTSQVCNSYFDRLPLPICNSNVQSSEIVGSVSKNHFMEVGVTSQVYNPYSNQFPLPICDSNIQSSEIFIQEVGVMSQICNSYLDRLSLPICDSNVRSSEIVIKEVGVTSQVCNPYSDWLPLPICDSNVRSNDIVESISKNHLMEIGITSQVFNPCSDWRPLSTCDSSEQSSEIVKGVMDISPMPYFYHPCSDRLPLHVGPSDERPSEIVWGVSENHCMGGQSQRIDYPSGATTEEPSSEAIAATNSTVLPIKNGQSTSLCQPILPSDWQMVASPLALSAVGCPPSTGYRPLGLGSRQNDTVHSGAFDGSSTSIGEMEEYSFMEDLKRILKNRGEPQENLNFKYLEVHRGKKKRKPNDGRRRCGCKKSKCIQRYCECFSSGFFCDERCECKGCNNTIEHETLVLNKRTEIERRNSLAFAPKIVPLHQEDSELPGIWLSGWYKRGCSCSKSKCLQKYCECYQANLKCSVTCCCKGCGNVDTQEHDAGPAYFMIGEAMNNNVNTHGFHRNGGEMFPQAAASNYSIGRQARLSSSSSVLPRQQWPPTDSTSFGNSLSSYPTFVPQLLTPMSFYEVPANQNGSPLILNDSRFPVGINSPDRKRVPPPLFPVPNAGSGMSTPSLPAPYPLQGR